MMRLPRRLPIVLGMAVYLGLLLMVSLSVLQDGGHLGFGSGRIRATWSDLGMLLTLLVAAPFVIWAAIASWRKR